MAKYLISLVLGPQISNIFMYSLTRSFCGRVGRTPVPKCSGCNVGAGGVVAATCTHITAGTGCAFRAIRQIRHNRANNQTNQSVSECVRVGTKIAIVGVNNYFSHAKMALR